MKHLRLASQLLEQDSQEDNTFFCEKDLSETPIMFYRKLYDSYNCLIQDCKEAGFVVF